MHDAMQMRLAQQLWTNLSKIQIKYLYFCSKTFYFCNKKVGENILQALCDSSGQSLDSGQSCS